MEVHHHPHNSGKKWTHYFWEFLMLFLAVFCGYMAENWREHGIEHKREKQYITAMVADLKIDTMKIREVISTNEEQLRYFDSLRNILKSPSVLNRTAELYYFFLPTTHYDLFSATTRAIDQLQNSGGMRLIRKNYVSDSIVTYYSAFKETKSQGETWLRYFDQFHEDAFEIFDYSQIDTLFYEPDQILSSGRAFTLLTTENAKIKTLYNKLFALRFILRSYLDFLKKLSQRADRTLAFLKKEYHLN